MEREIKSLLLVSLTLFSVLVTPVAATAPETTNEPPLPDAGLDQTVVEGSTVFLDGGGSRDPDGNVSTTEWSIRTPSGADLDPDCPSCTRTSFRADSVGVYEVTLTVTDDDDASRSDTLYVTVEAGDPPSVSLSGDRNLTVGDRGRFTADVTRGDAPVSYVRFESDGRTLANRSVSGDSASESVEASFSSPGTRTVTAAVGDANGYESTTTVNVAVSPASPPPEPPGQSDTGGSTGPSTDPNGTEDNGSDTTGPPPQPDLQATATAVDTVINAGDSVDVTFDVRNDGSATGSTLLELSTRWRSADTTDRLTVPDGATRSTDVAITPAGNATVELDGPELQRSVDVVVVDRCRVAAAYHRMDPSSYSQQEYDRFDRSHDCSSSAPSGPNDTVTVEDVSFEDTIVNHGRNVPATVTLSTTGSSQIEYTGELSFNGTVVDDRTADVPATGTTDLRLAEPLERNYARASLAGTETPVRTPASCGQAANYYLDTDAYNTSELVEYDSRHGCLGIDGSRFPPVARIQGPDTVTAGTTREFNVTILDYDDDSHDVRWTHDGDTGTGEEFSTRFTTPGTETVSVRVSDGEHTDVETKDVRVMPARANTDPVALLTAPASISTEDRLQASGADAYDPDTGDSIQQYEWTLTHEHSPSDSVTAPGRRLDVPAPRRGDYTLALTVTDEHNATDTTTTTVTVVAPPANLTASARYTDRYVNPGATTGAEIIVENTGGQRGSTSLGLDIDGHQVDATGVSLGPGQSRRVTLSGTAAATADTIDATGARSTPLHVVDSCSMARSLIRNEPAYTDLEALRYDQANDCRYIPTYSPPPIDYAPNPRIEGAPNSDFNGSEISVNVSIVDPDTRLSQQNITWVTDDGEAQRNGGVEFTPTIDGESTTEEQIKVIVSDNQGHKRQSSVQITVNENRSDIGNNDGRNILSGTEHGIFHGDTRIVEGETGEWYIQPSQSATLSNIVWKRDGVVQSRSAHGALDDEYSWTFYDVDSPETHTISFTAHGTTSLGIEQSSEVNRTEFGMSHSWEVTVVPDNSLMESIGPGYSDDHHRDHTGYQGTGDGTTREELIDNM